MKIKLHKEVLDLMSEGLGNDKNEIENVCNQILMGWLTWQALKIDKEAERDMGIIEEEAT